MERQRHPGPAETRRVPGYDAFISYSHALDGQLAPTLHRELERFAKPWYQMRALRVFRDDASLTANPGLWSSIEQAMVSSEWFVLMASPEAARSPWVDREVSWWLGNRHVERLLIVLTGGELVWDKGAGDFDWVVTTALPPTLRGALHEEPRWVDVRWLRATEQVDRSNPRLRDCIADVAAAVRGMPKDLLIGEHIRQHRRTMRMARGGVTALALLLVAAIVAAVIAIGQRNVAVNQSRVLEARQLAALAIANLDTHLDLAQLFAVQGYRKDRNPQTFSALFRAVTTSPHLVRFIPIGAPASTLAGSASGHVVAVGTTDGRLLRWDVDRNITTQVRVATGRINGIAIDANGGRIVASDGNKVFLWKDTDGKQPTVLPIPLTGGYLAISPSGHTIATFVNEKSNDSTLVVMDGATGHELRRTKPPYSGAIGFVDDATLTVDSGTGDWAELSVNSLTQIVSGGQQDTPGDSYSCCGYSPDAHYFAWAKFGIVNVSAEQPNPNPTSPHDEQQHVSVPIEEPDMFAVSADGTEVAVTGGGAMYVANVSGNSTQQLPGTGNVDALTFLGNGQRLVASTGTTMVLWDLPQVSRIIYGPMVDAPDSPNAGAPPRIAVSWDGRHIAATGVSTDPVIIENLTARSPSTTSINQSVTDALPLWNSEGTRILLLGDDGAGHGAQWFQGPVNGTWQGLSTRETTRVYGNIKDIDLGQVLAARLTPDGHQAVLVDEHGDIQVRDINSGAMVRAWPGQQSELAAPWYARQNVAAVSTDTATVAIVRADGGVLVTDVSSGRHHELQESAARVVTFADDRLLVERRDNSIEVWNTTGTRLFRTIPGDAGYTNALTAFPHTRLAALLTELGTVELLDVDTGQFLGSFSLPQASRSTGASLSGSTTVVASPSGQELITATGSGSIVRWEANPDAWIRTACTAAGRDLTVDEWKREIGTTPPSNLACLQ